MAVSVPVLTDGVVTLRAPTDADVDGVVAMASDPETVRRTDIPAPYGRADGEQWVHETVPAGWTDGTGFSWAVASPDGRFAGTLAVHAGPRPPSIGFALAPWARGRGLMSRAVRLAARWVFEDAGLPVLHWSAAAGDFASWRVARACGFRFEGTRRLSLLRRGVLHDGWSAVLLPPGPLVPRTPWWDVPVIEGVRVRLRPHTDADVQRIVEACSDPLTRHFLPTVPHPYTAADARAFVLGCRLGEALGQRVTWVVADRGDDRLLANVAVFDLDDPLAPTGGEIGYWAHPDARGRGAVTEAVQLAAAHAFTPVADGGLGRHRLQIGTAWSNGPSRHVAERAGFTLAGRYRQDGIVGVGDERRLDDGAWYERLAGDASPGVRSRRG